MSQGYTIKVAEAIKNADGSLLGVQLGRICLDRDISVLEAARTLGVTRQTVYQWFCGETTPQTHHLDMMQEWMDKLTKLTEA
jgi:transcriptional regulator with XRE-family HTH domain